MYLVGGLVLVSGPDVWSGVCLLVLVWCVLSTGFNLVCNVWSGVWLLLWCDEWYLVTGLVWFVEFGLVWYLVCCLILCLVAGAGLVSGIWTGVWSSVVLGYWFWSGV